MLPKVSLILTVPNREQYLGDAIASVLAQIYPHYELILLMTNPEIAQEKSPSALQNKTRASNNSKQTIKDATPSSEPLTNRPMKPPQLDRQRRKLCTKSLPHPRQR
jgi:hypothetical protein